ncbi:MAG: ABC transporter ATP-binding protein [Nitrospirota bacterium]
MSEVREIGNINVSAENLNITRVQVMIELRDIKKTFVERSLGSLMLRKKKKRIEALNGVSLTIRSGEIFGLLGPNGAGKTTLIKILATLILPDSGQGNVCGFDILGQSKQVRRMIGLVNTSERSFYWRLTGRQNLNFFAALYDIGGRYGRNRVEELLKFAGLKESADRPFMKYSSGQKQRLAVARALLAAPEVLLMDEPTNSLDPIAASEIRQFVKDDLVARRGRTVLWCTHNLKEAQEMCGRFSIIDHGNVIASGTLLDLKTLSAGESSYRLRVDSLPLESLKKIQIHPSAVSHNNGFTDFEVREREENIASLVKHLTENNIKVYSCYQKEIELQEIFGRLIHREH